jgi:hypothetical protein
MDGSTAPPIVRALQSVGLYRKGPDLVVYVGAHNYVDLGSMHCRLGLYADTGQPYVDHSYAAFEGSIETSIRPSMAGKPASREGHVRRSMVRVGWSDLACPARGFASSPVVSTDCGEYVRSADFDWRTEPGSKLKLPPFKHSTKTLAHAKVEHGLHTLTQQDRKGLIAHFETFGFNELHIAAVLGCALKTVRIWKRGPLPAAPIAPEATPPPSQEQAAEAPPALDALEELLQPNDAVVDGIVEQCMALTPEQRALIVRRIKGK